MKLEQSAPHIAALQGEGAWSHLKLGGKCILSQMTRALHFLRNKGAFQCRGARWDARSRQSPCKARTRSGCAGLMLSQLRPIPLPPPGQPQPPFLAGSLCDTWEAGLGCLVCFLCEASALLEPSFLLKVRIWSPPACLPAEHRVLLPLPGLVPQCSRNSLWQKDEPLVSADLS